MLFSIFPLKKTLPKSFGEAACCLTVAGAATKRASGCDTRFYSIQIKMLFVVGRHRNGNRSDADVRSDI